MLSSLKWPTKSKTTYTEAKSDKVLRELFWDLWSIMHIIFFMNDAHIIQHKNVNIWRRLKQVLNTFHSDLNVLLVWGNARLTIGGTKR